MITFNEKIDAEFKQMGFENAKELFANAQPILSFLFVEAKIPVKDTWALGYDYVDFVFRLNEPTKESPFYIKHITASTGKSKEYKDVEDKTFWYILKSKSPDPEATKDKILARVHELACWKFKNYKGAYVILMMNRKERLVDRKTPVKRPGKPF